MSAPDPRYRAFRAAAYGLYIAVVSVFCLAITISVTRSVRAMMPERVPPSDTVLTYRECLEGADALFSQLEAEHEHFGSRGPAGALDRQWADFRAQWLQRLRERESRCALDSHSNTQLKEVYGLLERVQDLYAVHASQYTGDVAGRVDELREALATARRNPAAGRLP